MAPVKQGIGLPFALVRDGVLPGSGCMIRFKFPVVRGKGWDAAILFAHSMALAVVADGSSQSSQSSRADASSQSSRIFEIVSSEGSFVVCASGGLGWLCSTQGLVVAPVACFLSPRSRPMVMSGILVFMAVGL